MVEWFNRLLSSIGNIKESYLELLLALVLVLIVVIICIVVMRVLIGRGKIDINHRKPNNS
jgi:hypothetical protein